MYEVKKESREKETRGRRAKPGGTRKQFRLAGDVMELLEQLAKIPHADETFPTQTEIVEDAVRLYAKMNGIALEETA